MTTRPKPSSAKGKASPAWPSRDVLLKSLLLIGSVFLIYGFSLQGTWIGDDTWYLSGNPLMQDPHRLWKAWFAPGSWVEFYPIEECVQWVQWQLWHNDTLGYHLTNVFLHLISSFLVWHLLSKFGLRLAWLGGLLFAVHPEAVDSVAQAVELKNALSLPPYLVAMCLYIDYEETKSRRCYLWSIAFFLFAMLCKITAVPFPGLILLYAWWKRSRIGWNDLKASLPFFIISLALGLMTMWAGEIYARPIHHAIPATEALKLPAPPIHPLGGFFFRVALVGQTLAFYFERCFWPINPMPIYPKWKVNPSHWVQFIPWAVIGTVLLWLWSKRHSWGRHALFGLGFFVIGLLPFLGFNTISYMQATWILDHMLYVPLIGLIGLVIAAWEGIDAQLPASIRPWSRGIVVIIIALAIFQSNSYARKFQSEETLARYNLQFNPKDEGLHINLGVELAHRKAFPEAMEQFETVLQIDPESASAEANLGNAFLDTRRIREAIEAYQQAVADAPEDVYARVKLGDALVQVGRFPEAIDQYRQILLWEGDTPLIHHDLGTTLCMEGKFGEAVQQFEETVALCPDSALAQYNLAKTLCLTGHPAEGIKHYRQAIKLQPDYAEAHNNLGIALYRQGNAIEAREEFLQALAANPNFSEARNNLQLVEASQNKHPIEQEHQ